MTDNPEAVWPSEWSTIEAVPEDQLAASFNILVRHCRRLAQERDGFHQVRPPNVLIYKNGSVAIFFRGWGIFLLFLGHSFFYFQGLMGNMMFILTHINVIMFTWN